MIDIPDWLQRLLDAVRTVAAEDLSLLRPPTGTERKSAVLILFAEGPDGPDLLFIQRSAQLRRHAGQPAFPGGAVDPTDDGPVGAALREASEETGLDPAGVDVLGTLPALWLPPSGFAVVPVLAWWREPSHVAPADIAEVASVARVPVRDLADPANRFRLHQPSGWVGPGFDVHGMLIWGFTAGLVDRLLSLGGWEQPWNHDDVRELPEETRRLAVRTARYGAVPANPDTPA